MLVLSINAQASAIQQVSDAGGLYCKRHDDGISATITMREVLFMVAHCLRVGRHLHCMHGNCVTELHERCYIAKILQTTPCVFVHSLSWCLSDWTL